MHIYRAFLFFSFLLSVSTVFAQTAPPAMAMPGKENVLLVDSLIKTTNHEQFFIDYCSNKVKDYATINNWPQSQREKILKSIHFKYYDDTIYNSYANYSTEELRMLLDALIILNKKSNNWTRLILTNTMMQNNLDLFVKGLIEGKYVMGSD